LFIAYFLSKPVGAEMNEKRIRTQQAGSHRPRDASAV
jgi:hypothetical protein